MKYLESVRSICQTYIETVENLEKNRKLGEGIFGLRGGPADNPCHDQLAKDLGRELSAFLDTAPDSAQVRAMLDYLYTLPPSAREVKTGYWMLLAVHGLTVDLLPRLDSADAAALLAQYQKLYPRWERLPVQKQVLAGLKAAAKGR